MSTTYAYAAEIVKSERDAAGDLIVYGKATGPDLDLDGQICDPTWLKSAMPAWMEWGNIREMHQPIAAGLGVELESIGDSWWLKSRCIDPSTALKIESGVLKGYSVGIKSPKVVKDAEAPYGRIVGGNIVEVSYVDRPCNPTAKMTICKSAQAGGDMQPVNAPEDEIEVEEPAEEIEAEPVIEIEATEETDSPTKSIGRDALRRVRKLVPTLATLDKAAPAEDVSTAQEAIACIARIIESEAASLAAGAMGDAYQIRTLLNAIESLQWFCDMEREEAVSVVELAAEPDTAKTTAPEVLDQSTVTTMITKAVTEATEGLRAQLAKVEATPIPGGPVLARPTQSIAEAEGRGTALAKAAHYDALAAQLRGTDNAASQGYAAMAREERAKVATA